MVLFWYVVPFLMQIFLALCSPYLKIAYVYFWATQLFIDSCLTVSAIIFNVLLNVFDLGPSS